MQFQSIRRMKQEKSTLDKTINSYRIIPITMLIAIFSACQKEVAILPDAPESGTIQIAGVDLNSREMEGNSGTGANSDDLVTNSAFTSTVTIRFGNTVEIANPLEGAGVTISQTGGEVVIKSTVAEVAYEISGSTSDGSLKVYSDKKFKLTLNSVHITNPNGPAINIQSGKRVFVVLPENSENHLTDGSNYLVNETEDSKGTFFSEGQLIFSGTGKLTVAGNYRHAIVSDDYVRIIDSEIVVTGAVKDGIHANDAVIVDGGSLDLTTGDDGIQCEEGYIVINDGTIKINSTGKAITASYDTDNTIDPYVTINGGSIVITSKDEGIESKSILTINDGYIEINATDDAINAGSFIYINGGSIYARSTGNDGIDSNGPLTITGGTVVAVGAGNPEAGIDCDRSTFKITGGVVVGIGGSTSSPTASVSTQRSVILGGANSGTLVAILADDHTEALTFLAPVSYNTMLFSSPKLQANTSYSVYSGGSVTSAERFFSLYTAGTYEAGNKTSTTFTTSSMVTSVGGSLGPGR